MTVSNVSYVVQPYSVQNYSAKVQPATGLPVSGQAAVSAGCAAPGDPLKTQDGKDKVYVLHSGLNDPENSGAQGVRAGLLARGIPDERIIVLPNEFPSFKEEGGLRSNLRNFSEFGDNLSPQAQQAHARMKQMIAARGLNPEQSAVTMIGHSAGGQASFGIAEVDKTQPNKIVDQIITLGSPILNNNVDPNVKVTSLTSDQDPVLRLTTGPLARLVGRAVLGGPQRKVSENLDANDKVIQVSNLAHNDYYRDANTMAMVADIAVGRTPSQPLTPTGERNTFEAQGPAQKPPFLRSLAQNLFA